ncbi:MarR family winged helix-turn-helix transcriptional regulator [Chitinibacteraceae bacterium HSL-7]
MPANSPRVAQDVLQKFRIIVGAMQGHYQRIHTETTVSGAQLWFLQEVAAHPGITLGTIAQMLAVHQSTASNQLEKLVRKGLVTRVKNKADRRITHLELTEAGQALLASAPAPARGLLQEAVLTMDAAALARLDAALAELVTRLPNGDEDAHTPLAQLLHSGSIE